MHATIRLHFKVLFAILVCGLTCFAQTKQAPKQAPRPGAPFLQYVKAYEETPYVTKIVLKNGMTVLVDEFKIQPVVSVQLHVRAGFFDDPPQSPGMAELVRAVVQRGMPDKTGGSFRQKVQAMGGIARSQADYSTSVFEIVAPSAQWKRALGIQSEAIQNPSFDPESVKLEAKLAQANARANLDDPQEFAEEKLLELAFNQARKMAKNGTISRDATASTTPDSLAAFYKAMYTPSRMLLVVSGDVNASEILNEVVRLYTKPAGAESKRTPFPFSDSQDDLRFSSVRGNVSIPHLLFGFHTVPENNEDSRALEVLNCIVGVGEASVLSSRVRDEKKLVLSSQSVLTSYPEFGYLLLQAKVDPANIDKSEIAIMTEIELLKREEPAELDMERAFAQLERTHWAGLETVSGRAGALAHFESLGDWKAMDRWVADIRKVKPSDVKRVAAKYLRQQNCSLLEYLPAAVEERSMTPDAVRNTFSSILSASADEELAKRNKQTVLAVKTGAASTFKFSEIHYPFIMASILRGPDLFIREDHSTALIEMGLFFPGGKLDEKKENAGITSLMTKLMLRGGEDIAQFYRQLEVYGGQVRPVVTDDYFGVYVSVLSQNFEPAFKLILARIREPSFDGDEVKRQTGIQRAELLSRGNSPDSARQRLKDALFESFPYSLDNDGTEASLGAITPEALKAWYESHVWNRKPVVALIGDTKGSSLSPVFVQNFSGSRIQEGKISEGFPKTIEKSKSLTQEWNGSESLILVGFLAPPEDDEDGFATAVLKGYSGDPGRFSQEIRDRLGVAYKASVEYEPRLRAGSLIVCAAVTPGSEESALKALREEIQRVHDGPISYKDFRSAVNEAAGAYSIQQQVRSVQIDAIAEYVLLGKGLETYENYPAGLKDVREEDLKAIAQRIFDLDKAVILVLRGKDKS